MHKFSITLMGATLAELYASAAEFAGGMPVAHVTIAPASITGPTPTAPAAASDDDDTGGSTNAGQLDSAGVPWDERIHSNGKSPKNGDGTWRRKRNLQDAYYDQIMAELRARTAAAPQPSFAPPPPAAPAMQAGVEAAMQPPAFQPQPNVTIAPQPSTLPPPPATAAPAPLPVPAGPAGMAFGQFMPKFSAGLTAGRFTEQQWRDYFGQYGITDLGQLQADPVKTETIFNAIRAAGWVE